MVRCAGCGGLVADVKGPTHRYMASAPGCWEAYGDLVVRAAQQPAATALRHTHVDCFAAQHPTAAATDRRQRQSVAVHLVALCLHLEHHIAGVHLAPLRQQVSHRTRHAASLGDWPFLEPPGHLGDIRAIDLQGAADARQLVDLGERWPITVWQAWAEHHEQVREWAHLCLDD